MKIDILQIKDGEESVTVRYIRPTPMIDKIIRILRNEDNKLWGKTSDGSEISKPVSCEGAEYGPDGNKIKDIKKLAIEILPVE